MLNNDACVGQSLLTSEVPKDRVMVILLMVGCRRTQAEMGIVWMEKGSVRLVMLMINYASAECLGQRQRQSWICDMERNRGHGRWPGTQSSGARVNLLGDTSKYQCL